MSICVVVPAWLWLLLAQWAGTANHGLSSLPTSPPPMGAPTNFKRRTGQWLKLPGTSSGSVNELFKGEDIPANTWARGCWQPFCQPWSEDKLRRATQRSPNQVRAGTGSWWHCVSPWNEACLEGSYLVPPSSLLHLYTFAFFSFCLTPFELNISSVIKSHA